MYKDIDLPIDGRLVVDHALPGSDQRIFIFKQINRHLVNKKYNSYYINSNTIEKKIRFTPINFAFSRHFCQKTLMIPIPIKNCERCQRPSAANLEIPNFSYDDI